MSGGVGKRGGGVRKMMNSENLKRERERKEEKEKGFHGFWFWQCWVRFLSKFSAAPISPRVADPSAKILKPLGRNQESARADQVSKRLFRTTSTGEWEVFRGPN